MAEHLLTDDILPQLREWADYNLQAGCDPRQLKNTLVQSGYAEPAVDSFLASILVRAGQSGLFDADPIADATEAVRRFWERSDVLCAFNQVALGEGPARMLAKNAACGIHFVADVLSPEECEALILDSMGRLGPSAIFDEQDGEAIGHGSRSSRGAMMERGATDLIRRIESRLAKLTNLPVAHGEDLQILHYGIGGEYRPHFDFFDPGTPGGARRLEQESQRLASVILYLSDVEAGGCTVFPELSLAFTPVQGAALMFPSLDRDGRPMQTSLHAGAPVVSGEKWIATKWLRLLPHPAGGQPAGA